MAIFELSSVSLLAVEIGCLLFCLDRQVNVNETFILLSPKGIYRVNGAKSRVEKLCQAFENGKDLVELSDLYPHDISNVLKLYLRQVGTSDPTVQLNYPI